MTNRKLIALATSVVHSKKMGDNTSGDVGCAILSAKGHVYLGVCMDVMSGMGFCAEHAAITAMVTAREYRIQKDRRRLEEQGKRRCTYCIPVVGVASSCAR